jgi:RNA polymerase sigma-70 factor (ECF subfamily)
MRGRPTATVREQGFEDLYRNEGDRLWRAVFAFAGDREVADDAVSEAFAQCIRRGTEVRDPRAWVWRAAFRIAAGELKERGRWRTLPVAERAEEPSSGPRLLDALARLPVRQRAVLLLFHYAGYPSTDIARMLGMAAPTVRVHLTRGRRRLRQLLEEKDD